MRLLITGHDGFTGRYLSKAAHEAGYEVHGLEVDLTDARAVRDAVLAYRPSHVVHLAAISAVTHADLLAMYQINQLGSLHLLESLRALEKPPQKIILASTAYVYGHHPQVDFLDEGLRPLPQNHYAISKYAMELIAQTFLPHLPIAIARPFNYTGVGHDGRFVIPKIIEHVARRNAEIELGNLDTQREYNDVRDVVSVYLKLLESAHPGEVYNIASGRAISIQMILDYLAKRTGHALRVIQNPEFMRTGEIAFLAGQNRKLTACIGPVSWRPIEQTLDWMLEARG